MLEVNKGFQRSKAKVLVVAASAAFVVVAGAAGFFAWQFFSLKNSPNKENEETVGRIVAAVGEIYMLPDEKPTVAQIQDKDKLKDQPFFAKAENGDFILVYAESKLALVYREKDRKIVNAGSVNTDSQGADPQIQGATTKQ